MSEDVFCCSLQWGIGAFLKQCRQRSDCIQTTGDQCFHGCGKLIEGMYGYPRRIRLKDIIKQWYSHNQADTAESGKTNHEENRCQQKSPIMYDVSVESTNISHILFLSFTHKIAFKISRWGIVSTDIWVMCRFVGS